MLQYIRCFKIALQYRGVPTFFVMHIRMGIQMDHQVCSGFIDSPGFASLSVTFQFRSSVRHGTMQAQLARCMFPLAPLTKAAVRQLAAAAALPTQSRPDSQGICFLGKACCRRPPSFLAPWEFDIRLLAVQFRGIFRLPCFAAYVCSVFDSLFNEAGGALRFGCVLNTLLSAKMSLRRSTP